MLTLHLRSLMDFWVGYYMSLHYLLDGYNILKQMPAFNNLALEDGRLRFLKWIEQTQPQGSRNNQVTVIFDGNLDCFGSSAQGDIKVIFSQGCSADDKIKLMVEQDTDKKNCVVVSNDKDVFLYARSLGAKIMSVEAFTSKSSGGRFTPAKGNDGARKYIPLSHQEKINKELSSIWLKKKP